MAESKQVTRNDVAKQAGVSTAVVSYVINSGPRPVSAKTRAKVQKAIRELGYYPNELARSLRRKQSATIGLMIPNLTNPVYAEIADSLERTCTAAGYLVILGGTGYDPVKEKTVAEILRTKQVDGVVVVPGQTSQAFVAPLSQTHIPIVVLEHNLPNICCITSDDRQGGRLATQHLLSLGHSRIGLIKGEAMNVPGSLRLAGYREALTEANIPFDPTLVAESNPGQAAGYAAMQQLLALPQPPTAVFAHTDLMALGAMRAIYDAGLTVPADLSVVGYEDPAGSTHLNPPLTTIKFPGAEMGRRAGQMILGLVQKEAGLTAPALTLPVKLMLRASTAPLPKNPNKKLDTGC